MPRAAGLFDPLRELLDRIPGFGKGFVRLIFRDVYDYLHDVSGLRGRTMERVTIPIQSSQGGTVAVSAHSLGSIVAYDILNTHPALAVDLFITIGSPLGIDRAVRNQLLPDAGEGLETDVAVRNARSSPHDSMSYLRQPRLAAAVGTLL